MVKNGHHRDGGGDDDDGSASDDDANDVDYQNGSFFYGGLGGFGHFSH